MDYKVTLAMPVYNVEKYVERALLSALNQTFDSIEFLIVDDKGTDRSMEIVNEIVSTHPRGKDVRIIDHVVNQGTGATKNSAIREARGEYLFFMDSDDEITPNCIQLLYDNIVKYSVDFVASSYVRKYMSGEVISSHCYVPSICKSTTKSIADYVYGENLEIHTPTWNKLYTLHFLREMDIECIPKHLNEDIYFTFQVKLKAASCVLIPDITYYYYVIPNSITDISNFSKEKVLSIANQNREILSLKRNFIKKYENKYWYSALVTSILIEAYYFSFILLSSNIENRKEYIINMLRFPINFKILRKIGTLRLYFYFVLSCLPYQLKISFIKLLYKYKKTKNNID